MTESKLIWTRPEPRERRPRFNRDQIAATALRIADADGFDAVTMKRIAAELGAGTMTLYYYVRTKADIIALMHDAIMADVLLPELPPGWREAVAAIARRTREVLLAHPWSLATLNDAQFGPNAMRHYEQSLAALQGVDLAAQDRMALLAIVDDFVVGNCLHAIEATTRARIGAADPAYVAEAVTFATQLLATGDYPLLSALQQAASTPAAGDETAETAETAGPALTDEALNAQFELGLRALLDGLETGLIGSTSGLDTAGG